MPSARITKTAVDALGAAPRDTFLWDDELKGFGVRCTPNGSRSYVFQYRMGGRESSSRRYTIGRHGSPWTPSTARKEAERLSLMAQQGVDPVQADHERRRQAVDLAFEPYVETFVELYLKKRWKQWPLGAGVLRREAVPVLRRKPLPLIKRADLNPIWDHLQERPAVARLTHATLRKMMKWAVSRGDLERSPLEGVDPPPAVPARDRVLSDDELALLWSGAESVGWPFEGLIKLLMLTGQRREEVAGLTWAELDRGDAIWTLPAARSKNGKPHLIPLNDSAVEVLDQTAGSKEWPRIGLVFSTTGQTPVSGFSKAKRKLDEHFAIAAVAGLTWAELDRGDAMWTLPAARPKNGKPHLIPLNDSAVDVLDQTAGSKDWPRNGLVFSTTGRTPVPDCSKAKRKLEVQFAIATGDGASSLPWRLHDIRRTVATGLQRLGVRFEVTEAVLNHLSGARSGVAGVYQRHDWKAEKRAALAEWGKHVQELTD